MQVRKLSLKELYEAYEVVQKHYKELSYEEFEDLVYEMRENYIMFGVFEKEKLLAYAGVEVVTTLKHKRHIRVYELIAKEEKAKQELINYLEDFAKISMAKEVLYE